MAKINIADYRRPDVYINEIDSSVRAIPAQQTIVNLIPGFSRKGPFNRPVLIQNGADRQDVYGPIDRNLEKKGCFFHRTIDICLQSGPVYGLNLLNANDELDLLEWRSVSTRPDVVNAVDGQTAPYRSYFNRAEFWTRDTEALLKIAKDEMGTNIDKILHFTNFSDRTISTFVYKSTAKGFDVTAEVFYGSKDKVPTYLRPTDLISDYMIDLAIVGGDWSDYQTLATDPIFGKYFSTAGLRKTEVVNFLNDKNINKIQTYTVSLIPYFRDQNGRNMFVETVINADTDRTGLFCAFDIDLFEADVPQGLVDLIGNNLVGESTTSIDYLSYKETIGGNTLYNETKLDQLGNTWGMGTSPGGTNTTEGNGDRTNLKRNYSIIGTAQVELSGNTTATPAWRVNTSATFILNNTEIVTANTNYVDFSPLDSGVRAVIVGNMRVDAVYLSSTGIFTVAEGSPVASSVTLVTASPTVPTDAFVLGYIKHENTGTYSSTYFGVNIDNAGSYIPLFGSGDTTITGSNNSVTITFNDTAGNITPNNYAAYRRIQNFGELSSIATSNKGLVIASGGTKHELATATVLVINTPASNRAVSITVVDNVDIYTETAAGNFTIYREDYEFIVGTDTLITTSAKKTSTTGVLGKYSQLYVDYNEGAINTGDYAYEKWHTGHIGVSFVDVDGDDYIYIPSMATGDTNGIAAGDLLYIVGSTHNDGLFVVIERPSGTFATGDTLPTWGPNPTDKSLYVKVNENLTVDLLENTIDLYDANEKRTLKMFMAGADMNLEFTDSTFSSTPLSSVINDYGLRVFSLRTNYKQTVEIEEVLEPNKILVDAARYPEVTVGDYLEAYYDIAEIDVLNNEMPKKITRILSKMQYSQDTTKSVITTDSKIAVNDFNGDLQTTRYTTISNYVNNYQAITLTGFRVRQDSMPNGTESRQSAILSVMSKGTNLFKGLVNKNKINWRYLVDAFGLGLIANSKQEFVDLCGERLNVFGILNMPSAKSFKNSTSPSFLDEDGVLSVEHISTGGDLESNPAFLYSFGQGVGQSCVGYFFPYVNVDDSGRPLSMPPAAVVLNTFMRKHLTRVSSVYPWTIAAGLTNGRISGIGNVEMDLTPEDIEFLNDMNANPIVYKMNRGFVIETNNTAQVTPRSSLSYINSREVLIELENRMRNMLIEYQWKFNTPEIRAEIKLKADEICQEFVDRNGIFAFENVMDESNNTPDLIDAQIGVLDIFIEISKSMGIIINNITILKTGDIASGGFR